MCSSLGAGGPCNGSWAGDAARVLAVGIFSVFPPKLGGKSSLTKPNPPQFALLGCWVIPGGAEMLVLEI